MQHFDVTSVYYNTRMKFFIIDWLVNARPRFARVGVLLFIMAIQVYHLLVFSL